LTSGSGTDCYNFGGGGGATFFSTIATVVTVGFCTGFEKTCVFFNYKSIDEVVF
jgi:hypothetical protein